MGNINLIAVVLVAVASMGIGFVWYSTSLFGKPWMKEVGKNMEELKGAGVGYFLTAMGSLIMGIIMHIVMNYTNTTKVIDGAFLGIILWLGFVATSFLTNYVFAGRSLKLFLIDIGYFLITFIAAGAIIGYFK